MKVNTRLTRIVELLSNKKTASEISRELKISKVAVHKHIKRLIEDNIIVESPESTSNMKFYRVNQILTMSEKGLTQGSYHLLFDPHNYALKFRIVPNGHGIPFERKVEKRNWDAEYLQCDTVIFEKTTKHLIGYIGDHLKFQINKSSDVERVKSMIHSIIIQEAVKVVAEYNIKADLKHPIVSRKEMGIIDPQIEPDNMKIHSENYKKVYPDKIEFYDEHSLKNFIDNRIYDNGAGEVRDSVEQLRNELRGSVSTQRAIANTQLMMASLLKTLVSELRSRSGGKQEGLRRWFDHV